MSGVYPWAKFHRLIDRLPWHSHYKRALADDPDLAERAAAGITDLDAVDDEKPREISMADWDQFRDLAAAVEDKLSHVVAAVLAPHVEKMPTIPPARRPKTAYEKAAKARIRELEDEFYDDMVSILTPDQKPQ